MRYKFAVTGGPAAGKSSSLPILSEYYKAKGFEVYTSPEVATFLYMNGVQIHHKHKTDIRRLEEEAIKLQLAFEDSMWNLAQFDENAIILCDRGLGDLAAYTPSELWLELIQEHGYQEHSDIFDRYDMVIHLMSVACDKPELYTNENNPARQGTPELAKMLDGKTLEAWNGHQRRIIVDNSTDFEGKMNRVKDSIDNFLNSKVNKYQ